MNKLSKYGYLQPKPLSTKLRSAVIGFVIAILLSTNVNAQAPTITYTAFTSTCIDGNRILVATITSPSGVPTSGTGLPVLYWNYNTGPFTAVTAVSLGTNQYQFTFGAGAFAGSLVSYYIVARDNAATPSVAAQPSTGASGFSANPPSVSVPPTPDFYVVQPTLTAGTYLVGANQIYTTITDAVNAYNNSCLNGPVVFALTDISYGVNETFPILINNAQASSLNTLTIKPNTGIATTIAGNAAEALFKFNGADYITFDGSNAGTTSRNLTLRNDSSSLTAAIFWLASFNATNGATYNVIKNCNIYGNLAVTTFAGIASSSGVVISGTADAANSNNSFINNNINSTNYGIYLNGVLSGDATNIITGNTVGSTQTGKKTGYRSLYIANQTNITISSNFITGVSSAVYTGAEPDASGGIIVSGFCSGGIINNNSIYDIKNTSISGAPSYGISLQSTSTSTLLKVYNNFIHTVYGYGKATNPLENGVGIAVISGGGYQVYFNSVHLGTNQTVAGISSCIYIGSNIAGTADIRNNIFSNRQTTGVRYALYCAAPRTYFNVLNNNDYFSSDKIGYFLDPIATLGVWQAALLSDGNSTIVDPIFFMPTNATLALIDLHLQPASPLNDQGVSIAGITTDFDGTVRSITVPDIGADEFTPPLCAGNTGGTASTLSSTIICVSGQIVLACTGFSYGQGISYQWEYSINNTTWSVVTGETNPTSANPPVITVTTYYRLRVTCAAGVPGYSNTVTVTIKNPAITTTVPASRCGTGPLTLTANANAGTTVQWYTSSVGGAPIATGTSFTTPVLNGTTTYYAEPAYISSAGSVGPASPTAEGGVISYQITPHLTYFDVLQATTLASVDIFPSDVGMVANIEVYNVNDQLIGSVQYITIVSGGATAQTVPVNVFLQPGNDYYITINPGESQTLTNSQGAGGLSRNTSGSLYPYNSSDIIITGNDFNTPTNGWFHFMCLYNWKFINGCTVNRTAVTATIGVPSDFVLNATATTLCSGNSTTITASSTNSTYVYTWSPTSITGPSITVTPAANTRYTVTANDGTCINTKYIDIVVSAAPTPITISPAAPAICAGTPVNLTTTGGAVGSTTVFEEKFEGVGLPQGWDTLNTSPSSAYTQIGKWTQRSSIYAYSSLGSGTVGFKSNDSSKFFLTYSDRTGSSTLNTSLKTPKINLTGYSGATLSFWQHYNPFNADSIYVEKSKPGLTPGSLVWSPIYKAGPTLAAPNTVAAPIGTSVGFVQKIIDLTPFLAVAGVTDTFYLRFRYVGKAGFWWAIDNVLITGSGGSPIVWTPATGLYTNATATTAYTAGSYSTTVYANPASASTYTATSSSPNGCFAAATVPVTVRPSVTAVVSGTRTICPGTSATVSVALTGTAPWRIVYTNGVTPVTVTNIATSPYTFTVTPAATTTYTVTSASDVNNCAAAAANITGSAIITVGSISATISGSSSICPGTSASLPVVLTGTQPWSLTYSNGVTPVTVTGITSSPYLITVSPAATTTYSITALSDGAGCSAPAANLTGTATVTMKTFATAILSGTATVCSGSSTNLSVAFTGTAPWNFTYTNGVTPVVITGINTSPYVFAVSPLTTTTYSITALSDGNACTAPAANFSGSVVITTQTPVAGTISGAATVCSGTNSTTLTLAGNTGTIQWQSSPDNITFNNIAGATSSTFAAVNLLTTTYYHAVVTNGSCGSATTPNVTITVNPSPVAGIISGASSVCAGSNSTLMTLTGNTGTIQWQSSLDNTTFTNITGVTTSTYTAVNLTATAYYNAVITNGTCGTATTATFTISFYPHPTGILSGSARYCSPSTASTTTLSLAVTGQGPWTGSLSDGTTFSGNSNPINITVPAPAVNTTYTIATLSDTKCTATASDLSGTASILVGPYGYARWTGDVSSDWHNTSNWCGGFPDATTDCRIEAGVAFYPVITDSLCLANSITILQGGLITINPGGKLKVHGNVVDSGDIHNNGIFSFYGGNAQVFASANGTISAMDTMEINKSAGVSVSINKGIVINGLLKPVSGIITLNDTITMRSALSGTASIDRVGAAANIVYGNNGRFIIERYIPLHSKSWQLLSVPTFGQTVKQAWQEGATSLSSNPKPGYGTTITSNNPSALTLGFDIQSVSPSMKSWNAVNGVYDGLSRTDTTLTNPKGYILFIRGDRTITTTAQSATPLTLRSTGKIYSPSNPPDSVVVPTGKFQSVGNPYASTIDFSSMVSTSSNIDSNYYYVWDPLFQTSNGFGAYQTISRLSGAVPGGTANYAFGVQYTKIQSGQAVFVRSIGALNGKVKFAENNKISGNQNVFRNTGVTTFSSLRSFLLSAEGKMIDGNLLNIDSQFSNLIDANDATKLNNFGENFGIRNYNKILSIETKESLNDADTIFYNLANLKPQNYQFRVVPENMQSLMLSAYLVDKFTGIQTPLSLTDTNLISINVNANPASYSFDRFYIVFKQLRPVPVTFMDIRASKQDKNIAVEWTVTDEINTLKYEIEKSSNGIQFSKIGTQLAIGNNGSTQHYSFVDLHPFTGYNYYRIQSIGLSQNDHKYSSIVKVLIDVQKSNIVVSPNPIIGNVVGLSFVNEPKGEYTAKLYNGLGQLIYTKTIVHPSGNAVYNLESEKYLASGVYSIRITMPNGNKMSIKIIVD